MDTGGVAGLRSWKGGRVPVPRRSKKWIWAGRVIALCCVVAVVAYLVIVGLDKADKVAGPVGVVITLLSLFALYLLPPPSRPNDPPSTEPGPASGSDSRSDTRHAQDEPISQSPKNDGYGIPRHPNVSWPLLVGKVPPLASAFQGRGGPRARIDAARASAAGVVLTQVLSGGGGVGKSQLAAWYADQAIRNRTDLVVWVDASTPEAVVSAYAEAAALLQAPGADRPGPESAARALLDWLSTTQRSWLVVLDDITDPEAVAGWWPVSHTGTGWVLATTRRRDEALFGNGRARIDIDVYESEESAAYLERRLGRKHAHLLDDGAGALAEHLGHLPLALSIAAAYLIEKEKTCSEYLELFRARKARLAELLPGPDPDGYRREVAVTLLLALDAAQASEPLGLAVPAIRLAALLDPAGHPDALWTTPAVTGISAHIAPAPAPGRGGS